MYFNYNFIYFISRPGASYILTINSGNSAVLTFIIASSNSLICFCAYSLLVY